MIITTNFYYGIFEVAHVHIAAINVDYTFKLGFEAFSDFTSYVLDKPKKMR